MLIYLKEAEKLIVAVEGTGDNLDFEDREAGWTDYAMTSIYNQNGDELICEDAGQLLLEDEYSEYETDDLVDRLMSFWGFDKSKVDYAVLNT